MNALELMELEELEVMEQEQEQEEIKRFKVDSLESANWCLKKLGILEKQQKENEALAKKEIERIKEWQEKENQSIEKSKKFFSSLLEEYFIEEKAKNPKFKVSTPSGKITSKKQTPKWTYEDEKVITALETAGLNDLIRVKKELDKNGIKKALTVVGKQVVNDDGEIIAGIKVEDQPDLVIIKLEM